MPNLTTKKEEVSKCTYIVLVIPMYMCHFWNTQQQLVPSYWKETGFKREWTHWRRLLHRKKRIPGKGGRVTYLLDKFDLMMALDKNIHCEPCISVQKFMDPIHYIVVEIFKSRPKWWTDWPSDRPTLILLAWLEKKHNLGNILVDTGTVEYYKVINI